MSSVNLLILIICIISNEKSGTAKLLNFIGYAKNKNHDNEIYIGYTFHKYN